MKRIAEFCAKISPKAMLVLRVGLPIISASLTALAVRMKNDAVTKPHIVMTTYPEMFAHLLAGIAFIVLGAMIFDLAERRK